MIVVLDTNVLISAFLSPQGTPAKVFARWMLGEFDVVTSPQLVRELARALTYEQVRKYTKHSDEEIAAIVEQYQASTKIIDPDLTISMIEKDPPDNRVLECAVAGEASFIITGDTHLLELKEYQSIVIILPASFLTVLKHEER
jgi:putative PIN family toxin of toxin-antitoxin system